MDPKSVKGSGNDQVAVNSNGEHEAQNRAIVSKVSHKIGKRKRQDDCGSKCGGAQLTKNSIQNYTNFMKSGIPERVLFYQDGDWVDFPRDVVDFVKEEFKLKKAAIEVQSNGRHFILDILYMIQVDLETASQKPIAWIDEAGGCFFPQLHEYYGFEVEKNEEFAGMEQNGNEDIKLNLQIGLNGANNCALEEGAEESNTNAKRIKTKQNVGKKQLELGANDDFKGKHAKVEEIVEKVVANSPVQNDYVFERIDVESVRRIFFQGMKPLLDVDVIDINKCSSNVMKARWELFRKQAELTQRNRGDPTIRYAWLAASKDVLSNMTYGLVHCVSKTNAIFGLGMRLTPAKRAISSANSCEVDESGVRHLVLCRVILGNVELVRPGSPQSRPSSETFDNGVDNLQNPSHYIVWNMNVNTHIYPEYVVSFKMLPSDQAALIMNKNGVAHHLGKGQMGSSVFESGKNQNIGSTTGRIPKSPWLPFSVLFEAISHKVTQDVMNMVNAHYEEMKSNNMTREEFIMKLRTLVGDELLKASILGLQSQFPDKANCVPESLVGKG